MAIQSSKRADADYLYYQVPHMTKKELRAKFAQYTTADLSSLADLQVKLAMAADYEISDRNKRITLDPVAFFIMVLVVLVFGFLTRLAWMIPMGIEKAFLGLTIIGVVIAFFAVGKIVLDGLVGWTIKMKHWRRLSVAHNECQRRVKQLVLEKKP